MRGAAHSHMTRPPWHRVDDVAIDPFLSPRSPPGSVHRSAVGSLAFIAGSRRSGRSRRPRAAAALPASARSARFVLIRSGGWGATKRRRRSACVACVRRTVAVAWPIQFRGRVAVSGPRSEQRTSALCRCAWLLAKPASTCAAEHLVVWVPLSLNPNAIEQEARCVCVLCNHWAHTGFRMG